MYSVQDRTMMTVAFVRFLRMLMAEVSQAMERGVMAGNARARDEVLVDVAVDPESEPEADGDGTNLMQKTLTSHLRTAGGGNWFERLQAFQQALSGLPAPMRNANIQGMQARCTSKGSEPGGGARMEDFRAVLVAMLEVEEATRAVGDVGWQLHWWNILFGAETGELPTSSTDRACFAGPNAGVTRVNSSEPAVTDAMLEEMAEDERRHREQREAEAREKRTATRRPRPPRGGVPCLPGKPAGRREGWKAAAGTHSGGPEGMGGLGMATDPRGTPGEAVEVDHGSDCGWWSPPWGPMAEQDAPASLWQRWHTTETSHRTPDDQRAQSG